MVVLKKLKSATLIEALVATVLIVVIFMVASTILNNLVLNTYSKKEYIVNYRLNVLEYELQNHKRQVPYEEVYQNWKIVINGKAKNGIDTYEISAVNDKGKEVKRERAYE
ncbi:hypothetical protein NAT51_12910 [Flavobacterium amniphilum]|uniref:hypothetical protein n=1 Tax=Flavobacterium amniphilum TaxID=1834035 RepID=UPI002029F96A|nr:hypothetical protein [Flavobacterium amniphilum]MCL9806430.1 hypothetical protein [Flavobacterium amniphilum]